MKTIERACVWCAVLLSFVPSAAFGQEAAPPDAAADQAAQAPGADELVGPPAPPTPDEVRNAIPRDSNAYERYRSIAAILEFLGMPGRPNEAKQRREFLELNMHHLQEFLNQAVIATKLEKCEFPAAFDQLDAQLFHIQEINCVDQLLMWGCNHAYRARELPRVGELLAARVRLARQLGGSRALIEKKEALDILKNDLNLIRAWGREADLPDRAMVLGEVMKLDATDPLNCRSGFDHLAQLILVPIAKQDPKLKIEWIARLPPGKAMEFAQLTDGGIKEIVKAWTEPNGPQVIRDVIAALNQFGSPHPLTGMDGLYKLWKDVKDLAAVTRAELNAPPRRPGAAPAAQPAGQ